jgi:Amt family ammonium transporter
MTSHATWLVFASLLMLMQAGFALVTTGLCRAKNAGHIVSANLIIVVSSVLAFWIFGFAIMFGGFAASPMAGDAQAILGGDLKGLDQEWLGLAGHHGFFYSPPEMGSGAVPLFVIAALLVAVAAVIPSGAMAERWSFRNIVLYAFWVTLPIAFFGNWVWGGGWLARLGERWGLGHGVVDLAGSSVIHMAAGAIALAGCSILGARAGKYARDGRPKPMPGHNLVFVVIGTLLLFAGWFGFNSASPFAGATNELGVLGLNTLLAGAAGGFASYVTTVRKFGKPDPSMLCNGILAGLVAISASCAFVNSIAAALIGLVAGFIVVHSVLFFEGRLKVDDPVGAISVHGVCGAWGLLSLGLFANGRFGAGWNGVHSMSKGGVAQTVLDSTVYAQRLADGWTDVGVTGAFGKVFGAPISDWSQLGAQCVGVVVCLVFMGAMAVACFKLSNLITPLRVRREAELSGLDLPETGAECYPDFHLTDKSQTGA